MLVGKIASVEDIYLGRKHSLILADTSPQAGDWIVAGKSLADQRTSLPLRRWNEGEGDTFSYSGYQSFHILQVLIV